MTRAGRPPRITLLGNFSGRNAGDIAILGNVLADLSRAFPSAVFQIPTIDPGYLRRLYPDPRVRPFGLRPWHGAVKVFGVSTARAMLAADLVLITDNILFDRQFFNPAFNYLSTISLLAPLCRRRGVPLALYGAGLGPIRTRRGLRALQRVLDTCRLLMLRDVYSVHLLGRLGLRHPRIVMTADPALNTVPPSEAEVDEIARRLGLSGAPLLTVNVNTYLNTWDRRNGRFDRTRFVGLVAAALDRLVEVEGEDVEIAFVVTQVMDAAITEEVRRAMRRRERARILDGQRPDYRVVAGLLSRAELHLGMRTHSLILAAAVGTPVVSINAYPKSYAFLEMIGQEEWSIDFPGLTSGGLHDLLHRAWAERGRTRTELRPEVRKQQARARHGVELVGRLLGLEPAAPPSRSSSTVGTTPA